MKSYRTLLAASAAMCLAADGALAAGAPAAPAADPMLKFTLPTIDGEQSFDVTTIPGEVRLDLLKGAVRSYIANRVNSAHQRHLKDEDVVAWTAYDEAVKADPLQTAVPKPVKDRPVAPDLVAALTRAYDDLKAGNVRKIGDEPKKRATKDPLVALVTKAVVRDVFEARKALDPKYSFLTAQKEVGTDGIAYLNTMIEQKVAAGVDRGQLEKMRDNKYVNPAKVMLGITENKNTQGLPSIL